MYGPRKHRKCASFSSSDLCEVPGTRLRCLVRMGFGVHKLLCFHNNNEFVVKPITFIER